MLKEKSSYYSLKDYLKEKYGKRVQKITVALPFTCPNIDGTKAVEVAPTVFLAQDLPTLVPSCH